MSNEWFSSHDLVAHQEHYKSLLREAEEYRRYRIATSTNQAGKRTVWQFLNRLLCRLTGWLKQSPELIDTALEGPDMRMIDRCS